jgi:hypothetical protein
MEIISKLDCFLCPQLGTIPQDDGKTLEGKYVKFKTAKRIIKVPHGKQNSCDLPCELPGLPSPSIPFSALANNMSTSNVSAVYLLNLLGLPHNVMTHAILSTLVTSLFFTLCFTAGYAKNGGDVSSGEIRTESTCFWSSHFACCIGTILRTL